MKKRMVYLLAIAVFAVLCLPAAVFANAGAEPVSAVFEGETDYNLEEGESDVGIFRGGGVNSFTVTFRDGTWKKYTCVQNEDETGVYYYEAGDNTKEHLSLDTVIEGGVLKAGYNTVYFRCYVPGFETPVDSDPITVKAYPIVKDVKFIQNPSAEPLWSYEGETRPWGNAAAEEGDQIQLIYEDGSSRTFEYKRYKEFDDYSHSWSYVGHFFENGEVKFDLRGYPLILWYDWTSASGSGFHYGTDQTKIRVLSGGEFVNSTESYDVTVYYRFDDISLSTPEPLKVKILKNGYTFTSIPEGAVVTCTKESGEKYYFRPAKVKGKNGDEVGFTLNGEDYADSISLELRDYEEMKKGLNRSVMLDFGYRYLWTDDEVDILAEGDVFQPMTVKVKTAKIKYSKLKKAAQKLAVSKVLTVKKARGTVTYAKLSGNKKITIAKKTGKVTVKKGLKKGTYKVKVKVNASGNESYLSGYKIVTFKIKVK